MSHVKIDRIRPKYAKAIENLQKLCFPTLAPSELLREEHILRHCELFPEGSFVALHGDEVVGMGSGFLTDFDFDDHQHTFNEIIAGGWYSNHDTWGAYYYGADISVHPAYRGRGVGRHLYEARKKVVRRLHRRGIVAGAVLPGFARHKHYMSAYEYVAKVVRGELHDSTLSFQLGNGFKVRGLLENYILDSAADNWSALIVWDNPDYVPGTVAAV